MEYRCISADCHIDLCWLPHDLFVANASRAMKDRMPFVINGPDGPAWVTADGANLGLANGIGSNPGGVTARRKIIPGEDRRLDRIAETGLFADGARGIFRPTTPELRVKEQDRDGLQAEVMYGLLNSGNKLTDRTAAIEFYRIYNDWLADFCAHDRRRFVGLASIPGHNVDVAVAEVRRVATLGLGGLDVSVSWDMIPLSDPYWDPLWQAAVDADVPVHFHTINPRPDQPPREELAPQFKRAHEATWMAGFQLYMAAILAAVIYGGALERYPRLRIVLGESGIGWIPYVLDRMDYEYEDRFKGRIPLKMKPSEYWHRQCRATFQNDRIGAKLLDELGVENVMWGSDYPHADSVFPDSQEYIQRQFGALPLATRYKVICENAGRLYRLM
jgi:predicted TIM-barrel fold metal-dependent hydrolase